MSQQELKQELASGTHAEPLLPIEKKLIAGSLITGITLLVVLFVVNHFFPLNV
ncbi:hypothetical protein RJO15_05765 [Herbaspirillum huttiense F1]|jgi:hypothetical protein|uniref:Uncharacterized protein n=1 Tax=Herbaspirillum huttiense subsp. lycopersici TaxID=3074428 RepID=A0ABU2EI31_9BURK|nr:MULTISPECIES: hypothetical protein [Herbaspirillum]MBP1313458.1 hypothetical protein [Herbaspirillum sp. 1130]MDR6738676.1 hypothetical protein [Herbaspirillum sp. 1173]MDR9847794.1 hypothetical protein [Herbaspirillum huttiense SE1]MDT0355271.1 hypothetical protein [Herbaspirillum huttiense F1]